MRFTDILYSKGDGIARIIINRPEVYNAIRGKTTDEMVVAMEDTHNDDSIRVLIIEGAGPNAFCSGRDQGEDRNSPEYAGESEGKHRRHGPQHAQSPSSPRWTGYAIGLRQHPRLIPAISPSPPRAPSSARPARASAAPPPGSASATWRMWWARSAPAKSGCSLSSTARSRPTTWVWPTPWCPTISSKPRSNATAP